MNTDEEKLFTKKDIKKTSILWFLCGISAGLGIAKIMMDILPIIFDALLL